MNIWNISEQQLMALPEITDLEYTVGEWFDDRMPYEYHRNPPITFQVTSKYQYWFSSALTDFMNFGETVEGVLARDCLCLDNDQPGIERINKDFWVMWDLLNGRRWGALEPVFRVEHRTLMSLLIDLEKIRDDILP